MTDLHKLLVPQSEWTFHDMEDVVQNMFDEALVEKLEVYSDGDYQGTIYALFKIVDGTGYFDISCNYGSCGGCDDWADGNGNEDTIRRLLQDVDVYEDIDDIRDDPYSPPQWREMMRAQKERRKKTCI